MMRRIKIVMDPDRVIEPDMKDNWVVEANPYMIALSIDWMSKPRNGRVRKVLVIQPLELEV